MPQSRPQHEVTVTPRTLTSREKPVHEEAFQQSREALRRKQVPNSARPPERMPDRSGSSVVADRREAVEQAQGRLEQLGEFYSDSDRWGDRARASGADLGGFFNDTKLDLAGKYAQPKCVELMDYMEYSERDGGLGGWLDRWRETMASPSFENMADVTAQIEAGVAFNTTLVTDFIESSANRSDTTLRRQGDELLALLTGVAHEVSRQTREVLNNGLVRPRIGEPLDAVREAFRRLSEPQARAQAVRRDVEARMVYERFDVARGGLDDRSQRDLRDGLRAWQRGSRDMRDLLENFSFNPDANQQDPVFAMEGSFRDIGNGITAAIGRCRAGETGAEAFLRDLRAMVDAMHALHASILPQLTDGQAQQVLARLQSTLAQHRQNMDQALAAANPQQTQAVQAAGHGTLRDFWSTNRDALVKQVTDGRLQRELEGVFKEGLGDILDSWSSPKRDPADKYGLAWQLVETLRTYRTGALTVLEKLGPNGAAQRASATRLMDSMIAAVMAGL